MKFDLSLQQYVEWEVKNVMPIKGKYGYRVILKYMDGSERPQQKSGFATEKEANAARDKTIGELYAGTYVVYSNVSVKEFLEFGNPNGTLTRLKNGFVIFTKNAFIGLL